MINYLTLRPLDEDQPTSLPLPSSAPRRGPRRRLGGRVAAKAAPDRAGARLRNCRRRCIAAHQTHHTFRRRFTMARVTVEDCIDKVENRFELVLLASHRARMIAGGSPLTIERDRDKNPVVALREIADEHLTPGDL